MVKRRAKKSDLILISLGPTATVLAYDLAQCGYQAIDIGQLDNEYDWCKMGVKERVAIPYKCVAEVSNAHEPLDSDVSDTGFINQIVDRIL